MVGGDGGVRARGPQGHQDLALDGPATGGGAERAWSAVLSYDYTLANTTGNLADTMRTIYVYVGEHV